jgi:hypothetical protein
VHARPWRRSRPILDRGHKEPSGQAATFDHLLAARKAEALIYITPDTVQRPTSRHRCTGQPGLLGAVNSRIWQAAPGDLALPALFAKAAVEQKIVASNRPSRLWDSGGFALRRPAALCPSPDCLARTVRLRIIGSDHRVVVRETPFLAVLLR